MHHPRLHASAAVLGIMVALGTGLGSAPPALAQQVAPPASPASPVPLTEIAACRVGVVAILPLPTPAANAKDYAAFLWSPDGSGLASGSIWVSTSTGEYRVSFKKHNVLGEKFDGPVDPVTFRLAKNAELFSAFVDRLDDPEPGPCTVFQSWAPGMTANLRPDLASRFASLSEPPATVPTLLVDPAQQCRSGGEPARTLLEAVPPSTLDESGDVDVAIRLAPDSSVTHAVVKKSSNPQLDLVALTAAQRSVFATELRDCRPVATDVVYTVHFARKVAAPAPVPSPAKH
jgi:hypothetical protein